MACVEDKWPVYDLAAQATLTFCTSMQNGTAPTHAVTKVEATFKSHSVYVLGNYHIQPQFKYPPGLRFLKPASSEDQFDEGDAHSS